MTFFKKNNDAFGLKLTFIIFSWQFLLFLELFDDFNGLILKFLLRGTGDNSQNSNISLVFAN